MTISAMTKRVLAVAGVASMICAASVFSAPTASAQSCSTVEGYAKHRINGVTEYYEDGRCGHDINRPIPLQPPAPRPAPPAADGPGDGCGYGVIGDVLCGRTGSDQTAPFNWNIHNGVHIPTGYVNVGAPISVGGGGGGGGTVTVGAIIVEPAETVEK